MTRWNKPATCALAGLGLAALLAFQTKPTQTKPSPPKAKTAPGKVPQKKPAPGTPPAYDRLPSGIEYRLYKRVNGKYVRQAALPSATVAAAYAKRVGQVMALHVEYRTAKDSVLFRSRQQMMGLPVQMPLQALTRKGGLEEALALLQPGDSAAFRFNADSLALKTSGQPAPPQIKRHGNTMRVLVKATAIQTQAEAMATQQKYMEAMQAKAKQVEESQKPIDDQIIRDYLQKNNLPQAQKTAGGTYYIITTAGTGPKPQAGQTVSVHYTGALLDGKVFDSSVSRGRPFDFALGQGQVIPGWDEGIAQLPKGSKATLLIPSGQGYGSRGTGGDIPPNAVLRFDVELVDVK